MIVSVLPLTVLSLTFFPSLTPLDAVISFSASQWDAMADKLELHGIGLRARESSPEETMVMVLSATTTPCQNVLTTLTAILFHHVMTSKLLSQPAIALVPLTPQSTTVVTSTLLDLHIMSVESTTSSKIFPPTELSPLPSQSMRTSLPTNLESTLIRLDPLLEVTPLRPSVGELRMESITGSVLTHGTTLGETKVPSRSRWEIAESTIKCTLESLDSD